MPRRCRKCGVAFQPKAHQIKRHDYQCCPCRANECREYRERRKAAGCPIKRKEDKAKKAARDAIRRATPEYKAHDNERRMRLYYANREYYLEKNRRWVRAHKNAIAARSANWRASNPEKYRRLLVKKDLAESLGISMRYVSDEIVDAKLAQLDVKELIRRLG